MNVNPAWVVVLVITCLAALPRLINLGGPSFWNDEGTTGLYALSAMKTGLPTFPAGRSAWWVLGNYEPLYPMIAAQSFRAFGVAQFAARLPSALVGVATVPVAFLLGRNARDEYVGITLAVMVAFSTEYIAWSRQARAYMLFTFLILTFFLLVHGYLHRGKRANSVVEVGAIVLTLALTVLAAPGLFLFAYLPSILLFGLSYWAVRRGRAILTFFGLGGLNDTGDASRRSIVTVRRLRRLLLVSLLVIVMIIGLFPIISSSIIDAVFFAVFRQTPYPIQFIPFYGGYLFLYYLFVLLFAAAGAAFVLRQAREFEIALLVFVGGVFLALSTLYSLVGDTAHGGPPFERYLTPVLVFIFYFAAVGLIGIARSTLGSLRWFQRADRNHYRVAKRASVAVVVAILLVVPTLALPSKLNLYPAPDHSPANSEIPWQAFSPYPSYPSALYDTPQPNFQLACGYVLAHRQPTDVVMAEYLDAPAFYLGSIDYWLIAYPTPGSEITLPSGQIAGATDFLDGPTLLVQNVKEFDTVLMNTSGWIVGYPGEQALWGPNISLAVEYLTQFIPAGSDVSMSLYHWSRSGPPGMLESILEKRPDLQASLGTNLSALVDWAVVSGVTSDGLRPVLVPLEGILVNDSSQRVKPLAVLLYLFNHRQDLQDRFPEVFRANFTGLVHWAHDVTSSQTQDPAFPILEPYAPYYTQLRGVDGAG